VKNKTRLKGILLALIVIFILLMAYFIASVSSDLTRTLFQIIAVLGLTFLILGALLTYMARKEKGALKIFLQLTGISAIAPFAGSILHNLFYALSVTFESLKYPLEVLHVSFFIISLIVAPITFIIGAIGSVILLKKN
jgi:hypothetical protein